MTEFALHVRHVLKLVRDRNILSLYSRILFLSDLKGPISAQLQNMKNFYFALVACNYYSFLFIHC